MSGSGACVARSAAEILDDAGVPRPDGTPLGDALHVLGVLEAMPDDYCVVLSTTNVYGPGERTGLSLGDLRQLVVLAELGMRVEELLADRSR